MAKKESSIPETPANAGNPGITAQKEQGIVLAADFDDIETVKDDELVSIDAILAALHDPETGEVEDRSEWQATITATDYFWPAGRGLMIRGKVLAVEERVTSLVLDGKAAKARFYIFELTAPCVAFRSSEVVRGQPMPKPVQCMPGQHVAVLERTILRRLEPSIGKEVIVFCDGLARTKRGLNLWKYRCWERVQVASRVLPEGVQAPALPPAAS